jgi:hypothetical protein
MRERGSFRRAGGARRVLNIGGIVELQPGLALPKARQVDCVAQREGRAIALASGSVPSPNGLAFSVRAIGPPSAHAASRRSPRCAARGDQDGDLRLPEGILELAQP